MGLRTRQVLEAYLPEGGALPVNEESKDAVLNRYMAQHGLKSTRQRSLIIDTFFSVGGHLSVEELWSKVREQDAKVSVATVYRTMKLLNDCGLAHARNFGDGQTRYEAAAGREHHDHLICTRCGADRRVRERSDRGDAGRGGAQARLHGDVAQDGAVRAVQGLPARRRPSPRTRHERAGAPWSLRPGAGAGRRARALPRPGAPGRGGFLGALALPAVGPTRNSAAAALRARGAGELLGHLVLPVRGGAAHARGAPADYGPQGFQVVAVGMDLEGAKVLAPFAEHYACATRCWWRTSGSARGRAPSAPSRALPTSFILDRRGRAVAAWQGVAGHEDVAKAIEKTLKR